MIQTHTVAICDTCNNKTTLEHFAVGHDAVEKRWLPELGWKVGPTVTRPMAHQCPLCQTSEVKP